MTPLGIRGGNFVFTAYATVLRRDPCVYCGGKADTKDHIIPASKGGSRKWENMGAACEKCNRERGSKPLLSHLVKIWRVAT